MIDPDKKWYSVELAKEHADILKEYLRKAHVYYEPSEAGILVHFECHMTAEECEFVNDFLYRVITRGVS